MEDIIQEYLFQNKKCPLPSVGTMELVDGNATAWQSENRITAPVPFILLNHHTSDISHFVAYIANSRKCNLVQAEKSLNEFCEQLLALQPGRELTLPAAGHFYVDADGRLTFRQKALPGEYLPEVTAKSIRRNDAVHFVKVGDSEKSSVEMSEYFEEQTKRHHDRWWIWAAALLVLSASLFIIYWNGDGRTTGFGNAGKVFPTSESATYKAGN